MMIPFYILAAIVAGFGAHFGYCVTADLAFDNPYAPTCSIYHPNRDQEARR